MQKKKPPPSGGFETYGAVAEWQGARLATLEKSVRF